MNNYLNFPVWKEVYYPFDEAWTEDDFAYIVDYFATLQEFFATAAANGEAVISWLG